MKWVTLAVVATALLAPGCGNQTPPDIAADEHFNQVLSELRSGAIPLRVEGEHQLRGFSAGTSETCEFDVLTVRRDTGALEPNSLVVEIDPTVRDAACR